MRGAMGLALVSAVGAEMLVPSDSRITYIGRFASGSPAPSPSPTPSPMPSLDGYSCEANKNYKGEQKCFSGKCPLTSVASVQACADACTAKGKCTVFVYNNAEECYLKSDFTEESGDDPAFGTVSCVATQAPVLATTADNTQYFGWGGAQIACRFRGTSIAAELQGSESGDRFLTVVDGQPVGNPFVVPSSSSLNSFTLAEGLADGNHEVVLWKITEDNKQKERKGSAGFGGFVAAEFLAAPTPRARRLEFIGDSDTAGYCADGGKSAPTKSQNIWQTWAARLARDLDADFVAEAISGIGVKNWPIQQYFPETLPFYAGYRWVSSAQQIPDAVVILLGPNDNNPNSDKFITAYKELMEDVVSMYKAALVPPKIIHVCGGSINGFDPCDSIQTANSQFNAGRSDGFQGYYTSMTKASWKTINGNSKYKGCDSHYNGNGHEVLKNEIIDQVRDVLGWNDASVVV